MDNDLRPMHGRADNEAEIVLVTQRNAGDARDRKANKRSQVIR